MFWLFVMSLLVSNAASQCTFDDRLLESSVSRNALEQNWVKFVRHNGKTIVPFYFTRETTLSTQREMRKIFLQIEKEMGDGCPIQFVQTKDANDKRANIHIKQDSKKCGDGSIGGVVHRTTETFLELVMTVSACPSNLKLWRQIALHEIFHAFGITHTQRRTDRDKYIKVIYDNIEEEMKSQYEVCEHCEILKNSPYECDSLMHYQDTTFSIDSDHKKTMISINEKLCPSKVLTSINEHATKNDWNMLRFRLGCLS